MEVISQAKMTCSTKGSSMKRAHRVVQGYRIDFPQAESSPVRARSRRTNEWPTRRCNAEAAVIRPKQ